MKKLSIEVFSGVINDTACVYDGDGKLICKADGYDSYDAIRKAALNLYEEITNIKINKEQIDLFKNIDIGAKVRYEKYGHMNNFGYYAGVDEGKGLIIVSKIPQNDEFTGLRMTGCGMYEKINAKLVELYEEE